MHGIQEIKADIARLRDSAKLQIHLGTQEARQEWEELEAKWDDFVSQARLHESGHGIKSALDALGQELRAAYQRLAKAL